MSENNTTWCVYNEHSEEEDKYRKKKNILVENDMTV